MAATQKAMRAEEAILAAARFHFGTEKPTDDQVRGMPGEHVRHHTRTLHDALLVLSVFCVMPGARVFSVLKSLRWHDRASDLGTCNQPGCTRQKCLGNTIRTDGPTSALVHQPHHKNANKDKTKLAPALSWEVTGAWAHLFHTMYLRRDDVHTAPGPGQHGIGRPAKQPRLSGDDDRAHIFTNLNGLTFPQGNGQASSFTRYFKGASLSITGAPTPPNEARRVAMDFFQSNPETALHASAFAFTSGTSYETWNRYYVASGNTVRGMKAAAQALNATMEKAAGLRQEPPQDSSEAEGGNSEEEEEEEEATSTGDTEDEEDQEDDEDEGPSRFRGRTAASDDEEIVLVGDSE